MPKAAVDLLLLNTGQVLTLAGPAGPRSGRHAAELGRRDGCGIAILKGTIHSVGPAEELRRTVTAKKTIDARGRLVTPGLVDPHTHAVFLGTREQDFELRNAGKSPAEIAQAGGGVQKTSDLVRAASRDDLVKAARPWLLRMLECGTTTVEIKSGYGLTAEAEIAMLEAARTLGGVPTFFGLHEVRRGTTRPDYVREVVEEMIPRAAGLARYCDVVCEVGIFSIDEARRVLEAAKAAGMGLKMHAEQVKLSGGAELAAELGAVSADHLGMATDRSIRALKRAGTIGVLLPGAELCRGTERQAPARRMVEEGLPIALGSDFNPGTSMIYSMPLVMSLAGVRLKLSPAEAWVAATVNAAFACGEGERAGSLEPGKRADLVVWEAKDFREIPYAMGSTPISQVVRAGKPEPLSRR